MNANSRLGFIANFTQIAHQAEDDQDTALKKKILMTVSLLIIPAGLIWGFLYISFGQVHAAAIPIGYSIVSLLSLLFLVLTRRFNIYRMVQLLLILVCPVFLMLALGGFYSGSVVIIWSIMAPFGALVFHRSENAPYWLAFYLLLLILSGVVQQFIRNQPNLPESFINFMFVLNIGIVSTIAFILVNNFVIGKNKALKLLDLEREKSEKLLLNVLPKEIAPVLKEGHEVIAEHYESASVLFADIVGFTQLTEKLSPDEMVAILNEIFSNFDTLVDQYGLEKIRTIGDNYMVAAGVPLVREDHAIAIANLALDMFDYIERFPRPYGQKIDFRVGINSGAMVAGVIGRKKFHYDIWGDSVNTASRMESTGEPGRIQITAETRKLLDNHFICSLRGCINVKGKGEIETWFLEGRNVLQPA